MPKAEFDAPAMFSYKMRMSPEMSIYKCDDTGRVILFDEVNKKMLEMDPESLKMVKGG